MDYSNIDAEKGETANLASKTTSTPRKTMLVFGLAVIVAALCGFAVGTKTMTPSPPTSAFTSVAAPGDFEPAYIIDDCYGDKHVELLHKNDPHNEGWRCVNDVDGTVVLWSNNYAGFIDELSLYKPSQAFVVNGIEHPFDNAAIEEPVPASARFCDRAAYDTKYGQWRCVAEDDFYASSLSVWDLAAQARAAGTVVDKNGKYNLYEGGGWFYYDWGSNSMKWNSNSAWGGTDEAEYTWSLIDDTNYKLEASAGTASGWYRVVKECDQKDTTKSTFCWIKFYCTDAFNTDQLSADC